MKLFILIVFELLDILPFATLYAIYGLVVYLCMIFVYPFFLLYSLRKFKTSRETKPNAVIRWIKKTSNSLIFTMYGTELANNKVEPLLKKEVTEGVGSSVDVWKRVQLVWLVLMLRLNAILLILLCGIALWDRFLVERSRECDDEKACFFGSVDAVNEWNREPIKNCSNVTDTDDIVCFRFAYNVADTIGLVGGILSFGVYSMRIGSILMIFFYKQLFRCCNKRANRVFACLFQQLPLWIMLIAAAVTVAFLRVRDLTFYGSLIETFGIASTIALVLATPWSALIDPQHNKSSLEIQHTSRTQEVTVVGKESVAVNEKDEI